MKKKELIKYLKNKIKECESNQLDYFDNRYDSEKDHDESVRIEAFNEILKYYC